MNVRLVIGEPGAEGRELDAGPFGFGTLDLEFPLRIEGHGKGPRRRGFGLRPRYRET